MALPLIPFAAGLVVGGIAAYLYKDENAQTALRERMAEGWSRLSGLGGGRVGAEYEPPASDTVAGRATGADSPHAQEEQRLA